MIPRESGVQGFGLPNSSHYFADLRGMGIYGFRGLRFMDLGFRGLGLRSLKLRCLGCGDYYSWLTEEICHQLRICQLLCFFGMGLIHVH